MNDRDAPPPPGAPRSLDAALNTQDAPQFNVVGFGREFNRLIIDELASGQLEAEDPFRDSASAEYALEALCTFPDNTGDILTIMNYAISTLSHPERGRNILYAIFAAIIKELLESERGATASLERLKEAAVDTSRRLLAAAATAPPIEEP